MRTFFPAAYVVRECDQMRCSKVGQLEEWVTGVGVMMGVMGLHWVVVDLMGVKEMVWPWVLMAAVAAWYALRNNWVTMLWEELEDEERVALGDVSLPGLSKFWWVVLGVLCLLRGLQVAGVLAAWWQDIERTISAASP
jgi:hypothetical protein